MTDGHGKYRPGLTAVLRVMDLALVGITSPVWVPALVASSAAALIFEGPPVLFRQDRVGRGGEVFQVLKIRTMIKDADRYLDEHGRPTRPRITPIGSVLRRTGLDELPQLLNVLRGDMSLVGPRPVLVTWTDRIPGGLGHARFLVRPGLTGPAQIEGRNAVLWSRRLELDERFARQPTPLSYLRALVATPGALIRPTVSNDRNPGIVDDLGGPGTLTQDAEDVGVQRER